MTDFIVITSAYFFRSILFSMYFLQGIAQNALFDREESNSGNIFKIISYTIENIMKYNQLGEFAW